MEILFYDSNGKQKVAMAPPEYLLGDEVSNQYISGSTSTGSIASGAYASNIYTMTITGDGVNPTMVEFFCYGVQVTAQTTGTTGAGEIEINDNSIGSRQAASPFYWTALNAASSGDIKTSFRVAPFFGSKTFSISIHNISGSAATFNIISNNSAYGYFRATRMKTVAQYAAPAVKLTTPQISAAAQVVNNTETTIDNWTVEAYDTSALHDPTVNPSRITIPTAGIYNIVGSIHWNAAIASGRQYVAIFKNGSALKYSTVGPWLNDSSFTNATTVTTQDRANAGDYYEIRVFQDTGATRAWIGYLCEFSATWLSPATTGNVNNRAILTALPAAPVNGDEIYFQTAAMATAGTMPWLLRYNAGSSSAYKWEVISAASPEIINGPGGFNINNGSYVAIGTPNTYTAPLAGEYDVTPEARFTMGIATLASGYLSYTLNGGALATASDTDGASAALPGGGHSARSSSTRRKTITAAGNTIVLAARSGGTSGCDFYETKLMVRPVRVG